MHKFEPEPEVESDSTPKKPEKSRTRLVVYSSLIGIVLILAALFYSVYWVNSFFNKYEFKYQAPVIFQAPFWAEPRVSKSKPVIKEAQAEEVEVVEEVAIVAEPVLPSAGVAPGCEDYRAVVKHYFGEYTDEALIVAGAESRECSANIADGVNNNGTWDFCIFMINNEPATQDDIDHCVKRAWQKFNQSGKVWKWWYAVCPINKGTGKQYQKWDNIPCFNRN